MMSVRVGLGICGMLVAIGFPLHAQRPVAVQTASTQSEQRVSSAILQRPVTIELRSVSLQQAIDLLSERTGIFLQYNAKILAPYHQLVTASLQGVSLQHALEVVLAGTSLRVIPDGPSQLSVLESKVATQIDHGTIRGRVVNANTKQPIENARVIISGSSTAVVTGADGNFMLSADAGKYTITVRMVGFVRTTSEVIVKDGETVHVELVLAPSASVLDEVVVTGTVIATERKAIPTPVTVITAEDIEKRGITRIEQLFRGDVPGVFALEQGSGVYTDGLGQMVSSKVLSRGSASLQGGPNPLKTFVDGVELTDPSYLGTIDPLSIERIEIVTGPQAATVYGSGAMGGVMQIFTKKGGAAHDHPELTVALRYGMLESNLSTKKTPSHNHSVSVNGGMGAGFSYASTLSYNYTGQWRPDLFNQRFGGSVGATYNTSVVTFDGSFNRTQGRNGSSGPFSIWSGPKFAALSEAGVISGGVGAGSHTIQPSGVLSSQTIATNISQTISLSARYRITPWLSQQATIGNNILDLETLKNTPMFETYRDSAKRFQSMQAQRTSWSYNLSFVQSGGMRFSNTVLVGASGSSVKNLSASAEFVNDWGNLLSPTVGRGASSREGGGFVQWQLGIANQFFLTTAVRGEMNKAYGSKHTVDWTPRYGASYTFDIGDLSMKLLGAYGRATRAPTMQMREQIMSDPSTSFDPPVYLAQLANPDLTPEYSRGPEGGFEMYYGTRGSLSVNYYRQHITDLIESVDIDTVYRDYLPSPGAIICCYITKQYLNTASIRQYGWEVTASTNIWNFTISGTYSQSDSRVASVSPKATRSLIPRVVGQQVANTPTHIGSLRIQYAANGLSVGLASRFTGRSLSPNGSIWSNFDYRKRLNADMSRVRATTEPAVNSGYIKSDLTIQQVVSRRLSLNVNVSNIENSYGSEGSRYYPALGRNTLFGVTLRTGR